MLDPPELPVAKAEIDNLAALDDILRQHRPLVEEKLAISRQIGVEFDQSYKERALGIEEILRKLVGKKELIDLLEVSDYELIIGSPEKENYHKIKPTLTISPNGEIKIYLGCLRMSRFKLAPIDPRLLEDGKFLHKYQDFIKENLGFVCVDEGTHRPFPKGYMLAQALSLFENVTPESITRLVTPQVNQLISGLERGSYVSNRHEGNLKDGFRLSPS